MKKGIHPQIYKDAIITCACGNSFTTISTKKDIAVEICSACHPFYTGQKRYIDTEGQIDKFTKRVKAAQESDKAPKTKKKEAGPQAKKPLTLKDLRSA
ncbi:50S ribosomal protein L31 [candidate division WWE3 bacterium RIFCSPHIGHO2_01_FULL_43_9]|uniref:Large ribosomal subunit protein bL31 n=1 Tax=candidate division WWE3 bacterium RIFCSPHIGHO2_01_FULL_43_9 TaxID=1802618 RepID=A0A1F4V5V1_UNCKA|nr:MAG: 50S ribosomal protein L31 [candidate division WWE3 bacterium RIFCSPHIGHO2_01_FULL_43_9]